MTSETTKTSESSRKPFERLTARDIMNRHVITVEADMSVLELASFFINREISGAPVMEEGRLVGVVSVTDIVESASEGRIALRDSQPNFYAHGWEFKMERGEMNQLHVEDNTLSVRDIMTPTVYTILPDTPVSEIATTMIAGRVHRLLVAEHNTVFGIVTTLDMLKIIAGPKRTV